LSRLKLQGAKPLIKSVWLVLLAPLVVGLAGVAIAALWHPWSQTPLARTQIRLLAADPHTGLPPAVEVTAHARGICNFPSEADPVTDAYRCFGGNVIYDPCFGGDTKPLICIESPWSAVGVRFKVTLFEAFDKHHDVHWHPGEAPPREVPVFPPLPTDEKHPPWALELASGLRCVFAEGATFFVANQRANYECGTNGFGGGRGPWVIGDPDRSTEPWVVSLLPKFGSRTSQVAVRVAWY
jgi:hypothetical protein